MIVSNKSRTLLTVKQFSQKHLAFSEASLRYLIFWSEDRKNSRGEVIPGNGFSPAIVRIGRKVLIDEEKFFACVDEQNGQYAEFVGDNSAYAHANRSKEIA